MPKQNKHEVQLQIRARRFDREWNLCARAVDFLCLDGAQLVLAMESIQMAQQHAPGFLKIVNEAKARITECTLAQMQARRAAGEKFLLIDVREESEYAAGHIPAAIHLGKGVIERDVETKIPDTAMPLVLYCGGGFRSALAADNLQKMGYTQVVSMDGGIRVWRERGFPEEK